MDWFSQVYTVFNMSLLHNFVYGGVIITTPQAIAIENTQEYMVECLLQYRRGVQGGWEFFV